MANLPSVQMMEAYIRQIAAMQGIDPDTAVRVAKSEGLAPGVWQSKLSYQGGTEPSFGPFQLFTGGGLGNVFEKRTGLQVEDPSTWKQQIEFALGEAKRGGWSPWHGAARVGIGNWQGIKQGGQTVKMEMTPENEAKLLTGQSLTDMKPKISGGGQASIDPRPAEQWPITGPIQQGVVVLDDDDVEIKKKRPLGKASEALATAAAEMQKGKEASWNWVSEAMRPRPAGGPPYWMGRPLW